MLDTEDRDLKLLLSQAKGWEEKQGGLNRAQWECVPIMNHSWYLLEAEKQDSKLLPP